MGKVTPSKIQTQLRRKLCPISEPKGPKNYLWCQGTRLINLSNKTAYNFLTFVIAGWFTLETMNVLT